MAKSKEKINSLLMRVKEENEKAGLKLNNQKTKIMASSPIMRANRWGKSGNLQILFHWAPKSLWTVTKATKLKDACSLEEKL